MTHQEEDRIETYKQFIENGKGFFKQLKDFFNNEPLLDANDICDIKENIIGLKYLYKNYVLELLYLEQEKLGQIVVYETVPGTHFLSEPQYQIKNSSEIYIDYPGNNIIANKRVAYGQPSRSAEAIIGEICK